MPLFSDGLAHASNYRHFIGNAYRLLILWNTLLICDLNQPSKSAICQNEPLFFRLLLRHNNVDAIYIDKGGSTRNRFGRSNNLRLTVNKCGEGGKLLKKIPLIETHDFGGLMMISCFEGGADFDYEKLFLYDWVDAENLGVNASLFVCFFT